MKNRILNSIIKFSCYAILGYIVGWVIFYLSPTGTSQNAPTTCLFGAITFLFFKDYLIPYYKNQIQKK